jgi:molybdate transport system regulatory protein
MKSSARNQYPGKVSAIRTGVVTDEIEIQTDAGAHLVATITHASTAALGLQTGSAVTALIKAPAVVVVTDADHFKFSARNQIHGTVMKSISGAVNTEVHIHADPGLVVVAMITNDSAASLELHEGARATALFKASAVLLAVAA